MNDYHVKVFKEHKEMFLSSLSWELSIPQVIGTELLTELPHFPPWNQKIHLLYIVFLCYLCMYLKFAKVLQLLGKPQCYIYD